MVHFFDSWFRWEVSWTWKTTSWTLSERQAVDSRHCRLCCISDSMTDGISVLLQMYTHQTPVTKSHQIWEIIYGKLSVATRKVLFLNDPRGPTYNLLGLYRLQAGLWLKSVGLVQRSAATWRFVLHSSNEPGELSQCSKHDDSTINIVLVIITSPCPLPQTSNQWKFSRTLHSADSTNTMHASLWHPWK